MQNPAGNALGVFISRDTGEYSLPHFPAQVASDQRTRPLNISDFGPLAISWFPTAIPPCGDA
jgi:hypothetical protein